MASLACLRFTALLLLTLSLLPIHARELTSFSKAVPNEFPSQTATKLRETPASSQAENLPSQSQNGYGSYGRNPEEYFSTNERTMSSQPENIPSQSQNSYGLYGSNPEEYFSTNERTSSPNTEVSAENSDSREANAFYQYDERQKTKEKYGMSDTRAVENGKYFYDLNGQRHGDAYDPKRIESEGYGVKDERFGYGVFNYEGREKGYGYSREMEGKQNNQNQDINEEYYEP